MAYRDVNSDWLPVDFFAQVRLLRCIVPTLGFLHKTMTKTYVLFFLAFASLPALAQAQSENNGTARQSIDAMRSYLDSNIRLDDRFLEPRFEVTDCVLTVTAKWQRRRSTVDKTWHIPIGKIIRVNRQKIGELQLVLKTAGNVIEFVSVYSDGETNTVKKNLMFIPIKKQFEEKQFDALLKDVQLGCKN